MNKNEFRISGEDSDEVLLTITELTTERWSVNVFVSQIGPLYLAEFDSLSESKTFCERLSNKTIEEKCFASFRLDHLPLCGFAVPLLEVYMIARSLGYAEAMFSVERHLFAEEN